MYPLSSSLFYFFFRASNLRRGSPIICNFFLIPQGYLTTNTTVFQVRLEAYNSSTGELIADLGAAVRAKYDELHTWRGEIRIGRNNDVRENVAKVVDQVGGTDGGEQGGATSASSAPMPAADVRVRVCLMAYYDRQGQQLLSLWSVQLCWIQIREQ